MFCTNTALDADNPDREYELPFEDTRGYQCTPPGHYRELEIFFLDVLEENEKLKRRLRRCRR